MFWMHPMELRGDGTEVEYNFQSVWKILFVSVQDRCTVCTECTIGS
jgi:hypothetical protein